MEILTDIMFAQWEAYVLHGLLLMVNIKEETYQVFNKFLGIAKLLVILDLIAPGGKKNMFILDMPLANINSFRGFVIPAHFQGAMKKGEPWHWDWKANLG